MIQLKPNQATKEDQSISGPPTPQNLRSPLMASPPQVRTLFFSSKQESSVQIPSGPSAQNIELTRLRLAELGFHYSHQSHIRRVIRKMSPNGGTAMFDSLIYGCELLLTLENELIRLGTAVPFHFVHIILTDGHDTDSQNSYQTALATMERISRTINPNILKTFIIGVGDLGEYEGTLRQLARAGGPTAEYHNVHHLNIHEIFHHISIQIGVVEMVNGQRTRNNNRILLKLQNFAVLFNIDMSGSMEGQAWEGAIHGIDKLYHGLHQGDIVSAVVFNDAPTLIRVEGGRTSLCERCFWCCPTCCDGCIDCCDDCSQACSIF